MGRAYAQFDRFHFTCAPGRCSGLALLSPASHYGIGRFLRNLVSAANPIFWDRIYRSSVNQLYYGLLDRCVGAAAAVHIRVVFRFGPGDKIPSYPLRASHIDLCLVRILGVAGMEKMALWCVAGYHPFGLMGNRPCRHAGIMGEPGCKFWRFSLRLVLGALASFYGLVGADRSEAEGREALLARLAAIVSSEGYYERALAACTDYARGLARILVERGGTSGSIVPAPDCRGA